MGLALLYVLKTYVYNTLPLASKVSNTRLTPSGDNLPILVSRA